MKKSILFLGGGKLGLPAIKWAKAVGFSVIVNDKNVEAPGLLEADIKINYDSTDIRGLTTWALVHNDLHNIKYCYCGSDFGLLTVANIHQALDIKYPSVRSIINGLDKSLMKKNWVKAKIQFPKSIIIQTHSELILAAKEIGQPLVIKPTSSSGSQGVSIVSNYASLNEAFEEAKKYAENGLVICEQYIDGTHHDVNGFFWGDKFYPCGICDRYFTSFPYPVPHHGYFPSSLNISQKQAIYSHLENGARSMGINHGPVKGDCVLNSDGGYFYEISPRFHGDIITANTLGFIGNKNPIYQFFDAIYNDGNFECHNIDEADVMAGWKTLFDAKISFNESKIAGIYYKKYNEMSLNKNKIIKNNDQIVGLIWAYDKNRQAVNDILGIESLEKIYD